MNDNIFLLLKVTISTTHRNVHEAIAELTRKSHCTLTDTNKVKVKQTQIMDYKLKSEENGKIS